MVGTDLGAELLAFELQLRDVLLDAVQFGLEPHHLLAGRRAVQRTLRTAAGAAAVQRPVDAAALAAAAVDADADADAAAAAAERHRRPVQLLVEAAYAIVSSVRTHKD